MYLLSERRLVHPPPPPLVPLLRQYTLTRPPPLHQLSTQRHFHGTDIVQSSYYLVTIVGDTSSE